jgi:hypothetical protein
MSPDHIHIPHFLNIAPRSAPAISRAEAGLEFKTFTMMDAVQVSKALGFNSTFLFFFYIVPLEVG